MNLCDKRHDQICYDGRDCPVCDRREEMDRLEREVERLNALVRQLADAEATCLE